MNAVRFHVGQDSFRLRANTDDIDVGHPQPTVTPQTLQQTSEVQQTAIHVACEEDALLVKKPWHIDEAVKRQIDQEHPYEPHQGEGRQYMRDIILGQWLFHPSCGRVVQTSSFVCRRQFVRVSSCEFPFPLAVRERAHVIVAPNCLLYNRRERRLGVDVFAGAFFASPAIIAPVLSYPFENRSPR